MVYPIVAYGHPNLRKVSEEIDSQYPELPRLIEDMFETMYASEGVGLAAPQINRNIRLFVIDTAPFTRDDPETEGVKKVFINPQIVEEEGEEWSFNEGCLSLPDIREEVERKPRVRIRYNDQDFNFHDEVYEGIMARIIQHEYDHLDGILFVDRISNLRKMLLKRRLNDIATGNIDVEYKMIFPSKKRRKS